MAMNFGHRRVTIEGDPGTFVVRAIHTTMGGATRTGRQMRDDEASDPMLPVPGTAAGDADDTAVLPAVDAPPTAAPDDADRRMVLWLVGGGLALIVVAAVAVIALWPGADAGPPAALPGAVLPTGGPGRTSAPAPAPPTPAKATAGASASATAGASASPTAAGSAPGSPRPSAPASATLAPPPAADLVGAIVGSGGHCLDVRGGIALPGSAVSAYACNSTPSQRWTLGADGTLRVDGMCATPDGSAVHLGVCDTSAQWRAGSGGTLFNVSAANCLTDPSAGAQTGQPMTLAPC